jgi:hypothetical protein
MMSGGKNSVPGNEGIALVYAGGRYDAFCRRGWPELLLLNFPTRKKSLK